MTPAASRSCPCCLSTLSRPLGEVNGIAMRRCRGCKSLFTAHLPGPGEGIDYDRYYDPASPEVPPFVHERLDELAARMSSFRRTNRWLDVGFGAGALLEAAARAGWEAHGTELAGPAVAAMRARGFDVRRCELADAGYPPNSYDIVTMVEVVEHVPRLEPLLREAFEVLRPGGLLYLTTPHGRGVSARLLGTRWSVVVPPEHLQLPSVRGLRTALTRAGYGVRAMHTHGTNPHELLRRLRSSTDVPMGGRERVVTSYRVNQALSRNGWPTAMKAGLNLLLDSSRMGDKLKCEAVKPQEVGN